MSDQHEVGKRLLEGSRSHGFKPVATRSGMSPEECLEKAREMFEEIDLQWDLEQLEKVKQVF